MARSLQQLNYNAFTGGVITEASPLTFPDGASIEENNFELTKQGFRRRRLGLDAISSEVLLESTINDPKELVTFLWDNNGVTGQEFLAIATLHELLLFDVTDDIPGDKLVYRTAINGTGRVSLTSHAGQLIVANGQQEITVIRALGDNLFSERKERLMIRDRVGMPDFSRDTDTDAKVSLLNAAKASYRPMDSELYLDPVYPTDAGVPPASVVTPSEVTYTFISRTVIVENQVQDDGSTLSRYDLGSAVTYEEFMGYPIDAFVLEKQVSTDATETYRLIVVFREQFYKPSITAPQLDAGSITQKDYGVSYEAELLLSEYNGFFTLADPLSLQEDNYVNHPHIYNLWNQGWGEKRMDDDNNTDLLWPIEEFHKITGLLPANSDDINSVLYPNSERDSNRTADRFHPKDLEANPQGSSVAPQGRYVIDALHRGVSRNEAFLKDMQEKGYTRQSDYEMSFERTTGGCTTVAEYAGRVWFAGFSGDSSGSTIQMANKILYGQTADDNIFSCYQEADPTSKIDSALVDTDGGWVSIDAIDEVVKLVPTDTALLVFATNGIWAIAGVDGNMFTPTASLVIKITDKGPLNQQSIVQVDADLFYWAKDGLYQLQSQGYASFNILPLTKLTINSLVLDLTEKDFLGMSGAYDDRLDRIVWIIDGDNGVDSRRELIWHIAFQSFTINTLYKGETNGSSTEVLGVVRTPQFLSEARGDNVIAGIDNVVAGDSNVVIDVSKRDGKPSRMAYVAVRNTVGKSYLLFADLVRDDFRDWDLIDAPARLLTGYVTGGDTSRMKQVPSLTVHFNRTETHAIESGVLNESSCLLQSQWEWTNDPFANKWSRVTQAYRLPKPQIRGICEPVAQGIEVVTTRNKLRGRGRTVSLLFSTEPNKDCQILGWSMIAGANGNV